MAVNPLLALRIGNLLQNLGGQQVQQQPPQESIVNRNPANFGDFLSKIATGIASGNPSSILDPGQFKVNPVMNVTDPGMSADLPYDAGARMAQIYQPRTAINDQYTTALGNAPERNSPGALRNIAALIGSSISSPRNPAVAAKLFDESRFGPYYRAQDDYQQKIKNLALGAAEEDRYNTNQRQLAEQTVSREQNQAKIDEASRSNAAKEKIAQQRADTADRRAQAYIWKQTHPDWKAAPTRGGNLMFVNPQDSTQIIDTGIPLGTMTDLEKAQFGLDARLQEIKEQGKQTGENIIKRENAQIPVVQERGEQTRKNIAARGTGTGGNNAGTTTITTSPSGVSTRTTTKSGSNDARRNAAQALLQANGQKTSDANIKYVLDHPEKFGIK